MVESSALSAAQVCRVYAAAGVSVVFEPDQLRRLARLLDAHEKLCAGRVAAANAERENAQLWFARTIALNVLFWGGIVVGFLW